MNLLNNSGLLNNPAFKKSIFVRRNNPGSLDETTGVWTPGTIQAPVAINVSIQPPTFQEMQYMVQASEGGQRITRAIRIYNMSKEFVLKPGLIGFDATEADIVEYQGLDWIVIQIGDFREHGHQKVFGVRLDGQDDTHESILVYGAGSPTINNLYTIQPTLHEGHEWGLSANGFAIRAKQSPQPPTWEIIEVDSGDKYYQSLTSEDIPKTNWFSVDNGVDPAPIIHHTRV